MEQKKLSSADIGAAVNRCRKQGFSDEVCTLLRSDLTYGLLPEQTDLYLDRSYTIAQQKLLSHALREDYPEEVMGLLAENGLDYYQMMEVEQAYAFHLTRLRILFGFRSQNLGIKIFQIQLVFIKLTAKHHFREFLLSLGGFLRPVSHIPVRHIFAGRLL